LEKTGKEERRKDTKGKTKGKGEGKENKRVKEREKREDPKKRENCGYLWPPVQPTFDPIVLPRIIYREAITIVWVSLFGMYCQLYIV